MAKMGVWIFAIVIIAVLITATLSLGRILSITPSVGFSITNCSSNPSPTSNQIIFDPCVTQFSFDEISDLNSGNAYSNPGFFTFVGGATPSPNQQCQSILGGNCVGLANPSTFADTSVFTPIGIADRQFTVTDIFGDSATYEIKMASDICGATNTCGPVQGGCTFANYPSTVCAPTTQYGATIGQSGSPVLVNATSAEGKQLPTSCGTSCAQTASQFPTAPYIPNASTNQTLSPGGYCLPGTPSGGACNPYMIVQNFSSSKTVYFICPGGPACSGRAPGNYTATQTSVTQSAWYVGRWYFQLSLYSPGCPTNGSSCPTVGLNCIQYHIAIIGNGTPCSNPLAFFGHAENVNFQQDVASETNALNKVSILTSATLGIGFFIPSSWINTNQDWYGIYGTWLGLNSNIGIGSCNGGVTCTTGLSDHAPLGVFTDPAVTNRGFGTYNQFAPNLSTYSSLNLSQIIPNNIPSVAYAKFPVLSFGTTWTNTGDGTCTTGGFPPTTTCVGNCTVINLNGCWASTSAATWQQPIIFDTIGSHTTFGFTYSGVQPVQIFGATATGTTYDGSNLNCAIPIINLFFACPPPLGGAQVTIGSQNGVTGKDGRWIITGIPTAGTYTVKIDYPGYYEATQTITCPQSGNCSPSGFTTTLTSVNPVGTFCVINPTQTAGVQTTPGFLCAPIWLWVFVITMIVVGIVAVVAVAVRGSVIGKRGS